MAIAVKAQQLGKVYTVGRRAQTLIDEVRFLSRPDSSKQTKTIWALRNLTFEIEEGETVGIIGRNGAGKSTLLKILSGITEPSEGEVEVVGRVGSLLEVGVGFHPNLTGRENVFLCATMLGAQRRFIQSRFEQIVEFSEIGDFLDVPIRYYSSGMTVRLGFSVAVHMEQDIIILDEAISVGDAAFQKKCAQRLTQLVDRGTTVLMVSHSIEPIKNCTKAIYLEHGRIKNIGASQAIIDQYLSETMPAEKPPDTTDIAQQ